MAQITFEIPDGDFTALQSSASLAGVTVENHVLEQLKPTIKEGNDRKKNELAERINRLSPEAVERVKTAVDAEEPRPSAPEVIEEAR